MNTPRLPQLRYYPPGYPLPKAARERLARDLRAHYEDGASVRQLAEKTGRSKTTILAYLKSSGTILRPSPFQRTT